MRYVVIAVKSIGQATFRTLLYVIKTNIFLGEGFAYHGITFGFYVDQLLKLADPQKRRVDRLFKEEIADPFGKTKWLFV